MLHVCAYQSQEALCLVSHACRSSLLLTWMPRFLYPFEEPIRVCTTHTHTHKQT